MSFGCSKGMCVGLCVIQTGFIDLVWRPSSRFKYIDYLFSQTQSGAFQILMVFSQDHKLDIFWPTYPPRKQNFLSLSPLPPGVSPSLGIFWPTLPAPKTKLLPLPSPPPPPSPLGVYHRGKGGGGNFGNKVLYRVIGNILNNS